MIDKNIMVVNSHQILSFSKTFAKTSKNKIVFLPGCSLGSLGDEIVGDTMDILKREIPEIGLCTFCCGKPSSHINSGRDVNIRISKLRKSLENEGVNKIITACPNCYDFLGDKLGYVKIESLWPILNKCVKENEQDYSGKALVLHDPCATRTRTIDHNSVREILKKLDITIVEPLHTRENTICCGQKNMMMALNRPVAVKMLEKRVEEIGDMPVVTYCNSCSTSFRMAGKKSFHILEILISKKCKNSWYNRFKTARLVKKLNEK